MVERFRTGLVVGGVLVVMVAAGCTSSSDDDSSGTTASSTSAAAGDDGDAVGDATTEVPDPCSLWTAADLAAATGVTFGEGVFNDGLSAPPRQICDWLTPEGAPLATAQVLVVDDSTTFEGSRTDATIDLDVPGADAAYSLNDGDIIGMDVDGIFVQVAYLPADAGADTLTQLAQLAEVAAANVGE